MIIIKKSAWWATQLAVLIWFFFLSSSYSKWIVPYLFNDLLTEATPVQSPIRNRSVYHVTWKFESFETRELFTYRQGKSMKCNIFQKNRVFDNCDWIWIIWNKLSYVRIHSMWNKDRKSHKKKTDDLSILRTRQVWANRHPIMAVSWMLQPIPPGLLCVIHLLDITSWSKEDMN